MNTRGVLLDFDGVLADTENLHIAAWERVFQRMGLIVPSERCAAAAEEDDTAFLTAFLAERGIEQADVAGWVASKRQLVLGMLEGTPRHYPGVPALVDRLAASGYRLGIVTTSWRAVVDRVLEVSGLSGQFAVIVAKEDVARPKPDPEPYRVALERLGLPAAAVLALEDSPTGLESARGAGVRCLAVGQRRPTGDWHGDAPFLRGLRDTNAAVARIAACFAAGDSAGR